MITSDDRGAGIAALLRKGYKMKEIKELTPLELKFELANLLEKAEREKKEYDRAKRKGRMR